jgi:hypothetical protein
MRRSLNARKSKLQTIAVQSDSKDKCEKTLGEEPFGSEVLPDGFLCASRPDGDRIQRINGVDSNRSKFSPFYHREHEKSRKRLGLSHLMNVVTLTSHRKESWKEEFVSKLQRQNKSIKSQAIHSRPTPPPMSAFDALRSPLLVGYEWKVISVPPGRLGISVMFKDERFQIVEVKDDSPIKGQVQNGDIIEGVDSPCNAKWDMLQFLEYMTETLTRTRIFYLQAKRKSVEKSFRFSLRVPPKKEKSSRDIVLQGQNNIDPDITSVTDSLSVQSPTDCDWNEKYGTWTTATL